MEQLTFDFIEEIVPIPDCSFLMDVTGLRTPTEVANEMVREAQVCLLYTSDAADD